MDLGELLEVARNEWGDDLPTDGIEAEVTGIAYDSRQVVPGDLFCCLPGVVEDGHDHAPEAALTGASALLVERPLDLNVAQVLVPDARRAMALLASVLHGRPSRRLDVVGVTGTNGKTSVVHMLAEVLRHGGRHVAESGTLTGIRTTPEAPDLQAQLAVWADEGVETVCMEVSSHALSQHRVDGIGFAAVAHMNLTRDHLDYHESMEAYATAKQRLLVREFTGRGVVVSDDDDGRERAAAARRSGLEVVEVSTSGAAATVGPSGSRFEWRGGEVDLPLPGGFAVTNALVVAELAALLGMSAAEAREALGTLEPVPGHRHRRVRPEQLWQGLWLSADRLHVRPHRPVHHHVHPDQVQLLHHPLCSRRALHRKRAPAPPLFSGLCLRKGNRPRPDADRRRRRRRKTGLALHVVFLLQRKLH